MLSMLPTTASNPQISTELQNYHAADLDRAKVKVTVVLHLKIGGGFPQDFPKISGAKLLWVFGSRPFFPKIMLQWRSFFWLNWKEPIILEIPPIFSLNHDVGRMSVYFLLLCLVVFVFSSSKWFWPAFKMFWLQYVLNMMNKNPMCFCLFVPRNSWSKLSLSASGGFRSRGFPSRSREYIVSFAFSEGRYIRHPSSRKTIRVFFSGKWAERETIILGN